MAGDPRAAASDSPSAILGQICEKIKRRGHPFYIVYPVFVLVTGDRFCRTSPETDYLLTLTTAQNWNLQS